MKQLRILTGQHAGVQLRLTRQHYRIASDDEADLQITDWTQPPLLLMFEEEGSDVSPALHLIDDQGQPADLLGRLQDFLPRRFGDVVLCAGPDAAAWPSDLTLMDALMRPARQDGALPGTRTAAAAGAAGSNSRSTHRPRWMISAVVAGAALLAAMSAVLSTQTAASPTPRPDPMEQVAGALRQAGVQGLVVRRVDQRLVVEGLLAGSAEMARTRAALQPFGEQLLLHRYASAADIVRQIGDALNRPGLQVEYRGQGVFAVVGESADPTGLRDEVRRISADIGPLVRRIDVSVEQTLPTARVRMGAMLGGDGLRYVQTADGTKHLSLWTPPEDGAAVPGDPSSSSPIGEP